MKKVGRFFKRVMKAYFEASAQNYAWRSTYNTYIPE